MTITDKLVDYEGFCAGTKLEQGRNSTLTLNSYSNLTYTCHRISPHQSFTKRSICNPSEFLGEYIHRCIQSGKNYRSAYYVDIVSPSLYGPSRRTYGSSHKVTAALQSAPRYENYHSPIGVPEWCRAAVADLALTPRVVLLDQNS